MRIAPTVLIVPMRNWNRFVRRSLANILSVLIVPMRNWNFPPFLRASRDHHRFDRTYEELKHNIDVIPPDGAPEFWSYLWGIETPYRPASHRQWWRFDRTYEELKLAKATRSDSFRRKVLIVPMRNWNRAGCVLWRNLFLCFDRTYEELKRQYCNTSSYVLRCFDRTYEELKLQFQALARPEPRKVLIVPMRNWNYGGGRDRRRKDVVLIVPMRNWNIFPAIAGWAPRRVRFDRTYEELKLNWLVVPPTPSLVLIVPMRNWNLERNKWGVALFDKFWSYLWGIETWIFPLMTSNMISFDRTYEELKLVRVCYRDLGLQGFDRTYEELKRSSPLLRYAACSCFDRTYEELKPAIPFGSQPSYVVAFWSYLWGIETHTSWCSTRRVWSVLIVPMRNWNWVVREELREMGTVLIVPMRNWNFHREYAFHVLGSFDRTYEELKRPRADLNSCSCRLRFWSYLWGIETFSGSIPCSSHSRFWSYLWGIETTPSACARVRRRPKVLIVPMRNWNSMSTNPHCGLSLRFDRTYPEN